MSNFEGYSKLINNIFKLSDEEIFKYYFEAQDQIDDDIGITDFRDFSSTLDEKLDYSYETQERKNNDNKKAHFYNDKNTTDKKLDYNFKAIDIVNTVNVYLLKTNKIF